MTARLRLFSGVVNTAGWRVRLALALKGIDYEYVAVRRLAPGEYRRLNPQGLMPTLNVDGHFIAQSAAILEYLEEQYPDPPLLPADPILRATARGFAQYITADLHPLNNERVRGYLTKRMGQDNAVWMPWYHHWSITGLIALEQMLRRRTHKTQFCFSDTPGWAELHLVPQMYNCRRYGIDVGPFPLLVAADKACHDIAAFAEAAPERMSDYDGVDQHWLHQT